MTKYNVVVETKVLQIKCEELAAVNFTMTGYYKIVN
jgi:hypothetical protein